MTRLLIFPLLCILVSGLVGCDSFAPSPEGNATNPGAPTLGLPVVDTAPPADNAEALEEIGFNADDHSAYRKLRHWGFGGGRKGTSTDSVDFVVTFTEDVENPEAASEIIFGALAVKVRSYYRDSITGAAVSARAFDLYDILNELVRSDSIAFIEPDAPVHPVPGLEQYVDIEIFREGHDEFEFEWYEDQLLPWNVKRIYGDGSSAESGDGGGSVDVDIYVIDGPIDHADINVVERLSFLPEESAPDSPLHGTHVAGTIAAIDDSVGVVGVAPGARVHSFVVLDAAGATTLSSLLSAVEVITARKLADPSRPIVVNLSIGVNLGTTQFNALDDAIARAVDAGIVVIVAAGNEAIDASTYSPAHAPGAIVVGASDPYDNFAAYFSNYGPEVDIIAPGVEVLSTADGDRYAFLTGTSMATPHVTGAAALILSQQPEATPAEVLALILEEAEEINGQPVNTTNLRVKVKYF